MDPRSLPTELHSLLSDSKPRILLLAPARLNPELLEILADHQPVRFSPGLAPNHGYDLVLCPALDEGGMEPEEVRGFLHAIFGFLPPGGRLFFSSLSPTPPPFPRLLPLLERAGMAFDWSEDGRVGRRLLRPGPKPRPPAPAPIPLARARTDRPITWIDTRTGLKAMLESPGSGEPPNLVGLDIETTIHDNPARICTVQLCWGERNLVIDALVPGLLELLFPLFTDPTVIKIIHNAPFERSFVRREGGLITPVYDTLRASRLLRGSKRHHALAACCERELGLFLDKTPQCSNWTRRPLSPEQIEYAALDAEMTVRLHSIFTRLRPDLKILN